MRKYKRDSELKRERMKEWERMKEREWEREKENDWDKMKNIKFEDKGYPIKIKNFILRWNLMIIQ